MKGRIMADKKMPEALKLVTTPEEERVDPGSVLIFELDGVEYRIPNKARPSLGYGYMRRIRKDGAVAAEAWMLEKSLGEDALEALENYDDLTDAEDKRIKERVQAIILGGAELPKG